MDGAKQLSELSASFPGALTSWGFKALASSQLLFGARRPTFNVGVSNVLGPQAPLYMNGARVERFFGVAPIFHGTALVFGERPVPRPRAVTDRAGPLCDAHARQPGDPA